MKKDKTPSKGDDVIVPPKETTLQCVSKDEVVVPVFGYSRFKPGETVKTSNAEFIKALVDSGNFKVVE